MLFGLKILYAPKRNPDKVIRGARIARERFGMKLVKITRKKMSINIYTKLLICIILHSRNYMGFIQYLEK